MPLLDMSDVYDDLLKKIEERARFYNSASDVDQNIRNGVLIARDVVKEEAAEYNNGWIPVEKNKPSHNLDVEVTLSNGERHLGWYDSTRDRWIDTLSDDDSLLDVIAWKEPSAPYRRSLSYMNDNDRDDRSEVEDPDR